MPSRIHNNTLPNHGRESHEAHIYKCVLDVRESKMNKYAGEPWDIISSLRAPKRHAYATKQMRHNSCKINSVLPFFGFTIEPCRRRLKRKTSIGAGWSNRHYVRGRVLRAGRRKTAIRETPPLSVFHCRQSVLLFVFSNAQSFYQSRKSLLLFFRLS